MTQTFAPSPAARQPRQTKGRVPTIRDIALRALLAIAVVVPASVLFGQVWGDKSTSAHTIANERDGIRYLSAVTPLTTGLTAAESVAVSGDTVDFTAIDRAMLKLQAVDASNDFSPGAHTRLAGLSLKVQQLHTLRTTDPQAAYSAYSEVTGLVLALGEEVRLESGLIRDQSADAYFLEDGAASRLPASVVAAGSYGDLVSIAINQSSSARQQTIGEIAAARASLLGSADTLGNDVRLAVDATASQTLSNDLLAKLDRFRLAIDALVPPAAMPNELPSRNDRSLALGDKAKVQSAASDLSNSMLAATDNLLRQRAAGISHDRELAVAMLVVVILVALTPLTVAVILRRRRRASFSGPGIASGGVRADGFPAPSERALSGPTHPADRSSREQELSRAAR